MRIIHQTAKMLTNDDPDFGMNCLKKIEFAARNCYASQDKITETSCLQFVDNLIKRKHESPMEFADITFDITTSRAVLAEITRQRMASFCVESQRYIQEAATGDIAFIKPYWLKDKPVDIYDMWKETMHEIENVYKAMIQLDLKPQEARGVLPNDTACRIIMKANIREWRHIFELRCDKKAYPQIRDLCLGMLAECHRKVPVIFDDLYERFLEDDK